MHVNELSGSLPRPAAWLSWRAACFQVPLGVARRVRVREANTSS